VVNQSQNVDVLLLENQIVAYVITLSQVADALHSHHPQWAVCQVQQQQQ
jgi:hypothetical protein